MVELVVGAALALLGAGAVVFYRARPSRAMPPVATVERGLFELRRGDVVQHLGTDYLVDGTIVYEQDGLTWQAHRLVGGREDALWLTVEEDDRVVVTLVEEVRDLSISDTPPPWRIVYRGRDHLLREHGLATATRTLPSGTIQTVSCAYWDYEAPDGAVLYVEDWAGAREVSHGRSVAPTAIAVLPVDDA